MRKARERATGELRASLDELLKTRAENAGGRPQIVREERVPRWVQGIVAIGAGIAGHLIIGFFTGSGR